MLTVSHQNLLCARPSWPCAVALCRCATRLLVPVSGASESLGSSISGASGELEGGLEGLLARRTRRLRLPSTCGEVSDTSKSRFQPQLQHVVFQRPGSRHTAVSRLICRRTTAACVHRQWLLPNHWRYLASLRSCHLCLSVPQPRRQLECLSIADLPLESSSSSPSWR